MFFKSENKKADLQESVETKKKSLSTKQMILILVVLIIVLVLVFAFIFSSDENKEINMPLQEQKQEANITNAVEYKAPPLITKEITIFDEEALQKARQKQKEKVEQSKIVEQNPPVYQQDSEILPKPEIVMPDLSGEIKSAIKEAFEELKTDAHILNLQNEIKQKEQEIQEKENPQSENKMKDFLLQEQKNLNLKNGYVVYKGKNLYIGNDINSYEIIDITNDSIIFYDKDENWNYKLNFKEEK